ncbi:MAG: TraR/DksA C4-type zinc finger protein [Fibrobacteres bacterium]|nr:TraR/DksA C4-type zinc finger protein [Fibrobacterota bacterium]
MNAKERQQFEKLLTKKRDELLHELGLIEESTFNTSNRDSTGDNSSYAVHLADQASDFSEREKAFHFASREGRYLHHIDEALRRVKNPDYGKCHSCSHDIGLERLKAVPHARLCIKCKIKEEEEKKKQL